MRSLDHRFLRLVALLAAFAVLVAGCGDDDDSGASSANTPSAGAGAFPVTIQHARGSTTIKSEPKRIVVVGYTDQEPLLAMGIKPVGAMDWFGDGTFGKWSWEKAAWGGDLAEVVSDKAGEVNLEKVASLRPDLILGIYADIKPDVYEKLAAIAPTVAQAKGTPYTQPWREATRTIAKAVGRSDEGEQLIKKVDDRFAAFRKAHPETAKEQALVVDAGGAPKTYSPFSSKDPRGQFLTDLGYESVPAIDKLAGKTFFADVAAERVDLLDVDRLFLLIDKPQDARLAKDRLYSRLSVVEEKRAVNLAYYKGDQLGAALAFNSVLSIPTAIDGIEQAIAAK